MMRTLVVISVYNNAATVADVAGECLEYCPDVVVVDDGSTDADIADILRDRKAHVLRHAKNMGKGRAILTALDYAVQKEFDYIITIDGDGQHYPRDLAKFLSRIDKCGGTEIIIGCRDFSAENVPEKSKFGRRFSNLWLKIETGMSIDDTQSGFRAYPVRYIKALSLKGTSYEFEAEVLTRAAWSGLDLVQIPIDVYYPRPEDRVSSFNVVRDNLRIAAMHSMLVGRRLVPWPYRKLAGTKAEFDRSLLTDPIRFFKVLLSENATPMGLAASAATGTLLAVLPIFCLHTVAILYVSVRLHLNKVLAVAVQNLYAPPFVPFLCIELGFFIRNGHWLTDFSIASFKDNWHTLIYDWFIGSLILAPFYAVIAAIAVYFIALRVQSNIIYKNKGE